MKNLKSLFVLTLFLFVSCSSDDDPKTNDEVANFINSVVDIMEANSINRNTIDWNDFRNQILNSAANTQNINETDNTLRLALQLLGDNHSFIRKQNGTFILSSSPSCEPTNISLVSTPENIGYIKVNSFSGTDQTNSVAYAESIQEEIKTQDHPNITGWIVDLRNNTGGNMWPMLAGVGPILGEGTVGYFVDPENMRQSWSYTNGSAIIDQNTLVSVSNEYELINPDPKVAVLLNQAVISSGEAIAVAFIGRNNTQSFGSSTCGLSTANSGFSLSDGSTLFLTTAYMADRNQTIYGESIIPDTPATDDNIIQTAIDYINH